MHFRCELPHTAGCDISITQKPQLSQRYRAMLRVIEYFAKSLEVTSRAWRL